MIEGRWVTPVNQPQNSSDTNKETTYEEYSNDDDEDQVIADIENSFYTNVRLVDKKPSYNKMMNAKVALQLDEKFVAV